MNKIIFAAFVLMLSLTTARAAENKGNPTGAKGSKFAKQHPARNKANKRVANQRSRIKNSNLSGAQKSQLKANDKAIKQQEHADVKANGGHLTGAQAKQINQEENANSALIHDEKHPAGQ
jgi:uncharacterized membrane protein